MLSKAMVDLDAINTELLSRGIHFHSDRVKSIRKELNRLQKALDEALEAKQKTTDKLMDKQRELLDQHNKIIELRETIVYLSSPVKEGPTCSR